jgi:hypothetical protein
MKFDNTIWDRVYEMTHEAKLEAGRIAEARHLMRAAVKPPVHAVAQR